MKPVARTDRNSQIAHEQLLQKAREGRIDVYFEGDSLTRRWGASDPQYAPLLAHWQRSFFGWNAADFGWGGDTVQNILWRLQNGELDGVHPKVIVLMAGTNNLHGPADRATREQEATEITHGIERIIATLREKAPESTIVLMGITPRADPHGFGFASSIHEVNERLARFADGKQVRFVNINAALADPHGQPLPGMTVDGLHLTVRGYQIWADALQPILTERLGPRAATDQAPPPTGDPSAMHRPKPN